MLPGEAGYFNTPNCQSLSTFDAWGHKRPTERTTKDEWLNGQLLLKSTTGSAQGVCGSDGQLNERHMCIRA